MGRAKLNDKQRQRLKAIRLAEKIGVTAAARKCGMGRVSLHRWRNRFNEEGISGLRDRSRRPHHHPAQTPPEMADTVVTAALAHPTWGCRRLVGVLEDLGHELSEVTVQKLLVENQLGRIEGRLGRAEQLLLTGGIQPSMRLIAECEAADPPFRERDRIAKRPGSILVTDIIRGGIVEGGKRLSVAVVIDAASDYTWAMPHTLDDPLPHMEIFHQQVLPDLAEWGIKPGTVMTPDRPPWIGDNEGSRSFEYWCREIWNLRHRVEEEGTAPNGFVEGFKGRFQSWFRREGLHRAPMDKVEKALSGWTERRNREPMATFPLFGCSPLEKIRPKPAN